MPLTQKTRKPRPPRIRDANRHTRMQFVKFRFAGEGREYWSDKLGKWLPNLSLATRYSFNEIPCFKGYEILW